MDEGSDLPAGTVLDLPIFPTFRRSWKRFVSTWNSSKNSRIASYRESQFFLNGKAVGFWQVEGPVIFVSITAWGVSRDSGRVRG